MTLPTTTLARAGGWGVSRGRKNDGRWSLLAMDPPNWWMLELEADEESPYLGIINAMVMSGDYRLSPAVGGPGYARFLMKPARGKDSFSSSEEDQARWSGLT